MVVGRIDAQIDISFLCVEVWSACSLKKCTIPTHRDDNLSACYGHTSATAKTYTFLQYTFCSLLQSEYDGSQTL